jgi:myo-inositol-1(or 4)-monophosphatase
MHRILTSPAAIYTTYSRELEMSLLKIVKKAILAAKKCTLENSEHYAEFTGSLNPYGDRTLVLDQKAEEEIISVLQGSGTDFAILTEEKGFIKETRTPEYLALVDPIDGSSNLMRSIPLVSIGVAVIPFMENMTSDDIELSAIESVFTNEMYIAIKGEGATRNGKRIRTSTPVSLKDAIISYDTKRTWDSTFLTNSFRTMSAVHDIRRTASNLLDLCWTAAGFLDGMVDLRNMLPIIHLSGTHMVFEAGGYVVGVDGKRFCSKIEQNNMMNFVAASSEELATQILKAFQGT